MSTPAWMRSLLKREKVPYVASRHKPVFTAQEVAEKERVSGWHVAKVVVVIADGRPVQLVLPANRTVDMERVRLMLNARTVRLAREDEMNELFRDCEVGAEPPLRHWEGVDVWMDDSLRTDGEILFQAGTHEDAIRMRFCDWFRVAQPRVTWFAAA